MSQTGVLGSAVGAPWETRHLVLYKRLMQLYTKQGDMGSYRAALVLSPKHGLGAVILSAGPIESNSAAGRETLMNAVGATFLPAAELQAREETRSNFARSYTDAATNSSVNIMVDASTPGLSVTHLSARGVEVISPSSPFIPLYGAGQSARLFPSGLRTKRAKASSTASYMSRLGFRASFFNATGDGGAVQDPGLMQWTSLGAPAYGSVTLDEWVFGMGEDGVMGKVGVRMLRVSMKKT
ncbi:hypothetical protein HBI26_235230 [Parastagonospora nodorum]|nr:hypothetical protein HBI26_235230 [Parastagonospora nodorum]